MNKKRGIGGASTFLVVALVLLIYYVMNFLSVGQRNYTYKEFTQAIETDAVKSIVIEQKKAVPTGTLRITLKDKEENTKYLTLSISDKLQLS